MKTDTPQTQEPALPTIGSSIEVVVTKCEQPAKPESVDSLADSADVNISQDTISSDFERLTVDDTLSNFSMDCVSANHFTDPSPKDEQFMRCNSDTNMLDIMNPQFPKRNRRVSLPLNQIAGREWDRNARPRRSSISTTEYQLPPPPQSTKKQFQSALYNMGFINKPPRRRSSSTSPRVRLIEQLNTECEVLPQAEYDRTGYDSAYGRPDFPKIKEELVEYHENEMEVHPDARDTVVHEWLKPKGTTPNRKRRSSIQTAKVRGAVKAASSPSNTNTGQMRVQM